MVFVVNVSVFTQKFVTGDLLLSLTYNPQQQVIQGIILKATNLPRLHKWGLTGTCIGWCPWAIYSAQSL